MVAAWIQSENFAIQHKGYPGHGEPKTRGHIRECPQESIYCQPFLNNIVFSNIKVVILTDEVVFKHWGEYSKGDKMQKKPCQKRAIHIKINEALFKFIVHVQTILPT